MTADTARYSRSNGRGLGVLAEPGLRRFAGYWCSKRGQRLMPGRSDIDPLDVPWALSNIFLVDYEIETDTFRYRVAGAEVEEVFSRFTGSSSMRGVTLQDMLPADSVAIVRNRWRPLVENGDVVYMKGLVYQAADRVPMGARILLPLSDRDDGQVTGLVGYTVCEWFDPYDVNDPPGLDICYISVAEIPHAGRSGLPRMENA
jgi:hypothetical protein